MDRAGLRLVIDAVCTSSIKVSSCSYPCSPITVPDPCGIRAAACESGLWRGHAGYTGIVTSWRELQIPDTGTT